MKVFITHGDGVNALVRKERPDPKPASNEIVVKMSAVSLNYRDLLVINGAADWKPLSERIPVSDGVGRVVAVGTDVTRFEFGDRACGIFLPNWLNGELTIEKYVRPLGGPSADGMLAEYVVLDENAAVNVPKHLTDAEAATLPVAAVTAWHAVARRCNVQPGETVLIPGTGGVALFAVQFVHALGARPIVTSSKDQKLEKSKALGAVATFNYKSTPAWPDQVIEFTGGQGVDHVIDVVGGEHLNHSLNIIKLSGTISFIGLIAGLSAPINTYQFVTKNVRIQGIETGSREMFEEMNDFIESQQLHPVIDREFNIENVADALRHLESARHFGKIVVTF